jgi:hypothetical protein
MSRSDNAGSRIAGRWATAMFWPVAFLRWCFGYDRYSAETIDRLVYSRHVRDLRLIVNIAALFLVLLPAGAWVAWVMTMPGGTAGILVKPGILATPLKDWVLPIGGLVAVFGGILSWCYQTGNTRLGTVDLFACEITTLCRICVINGLANTCIKTFQGRLSRHTAKSKRGTGLEPQFMSFDSHEAYTPIFDGNAKELRNLSVKAVINVTAFYTYWKSTRDAFRKVASLADKAAAEAGREPWRDAMRNVIYMQFLAAESARKAVRDLIEYEPNRAENEITILLNELPAYKFLLEEFREDVRHERLALRQERYLAVVPEVIDRVRKGQAKFEALQASAAPFPRRHDVEELRRDWAKAHRMLDSLREVYEESILRVPKKSVGTRPSLKKS